MSYARALPGLPSCGPAARSIPREDAFSEGFVVEFETECGKTWTANFAKWNDGESSIHTELGPSATVIVAGGAGYVVDANKQCLVREIGFDLQQVWFIVEMNAILVSNGLWFEAFDAHVILWRSRRISWDGIRNIGRHGEFIVGEAFNPMTEAWLPFRLDIATGSVEGGSFDEPD